MNGLSYIFEKTLQFGNQANLDSIKEDEPIRYVNPNQSITNIATDDMKSFLDSFISSIIKLNISEGDLSIVFQLCAKLISSLKEFNLRLIEDCNGLDEKQILETSSHFTQNLLFKIASKYRRKKIIESSGHYVAPKEVAIGTRWELQTKKFQSRILKIPRLIQSHFQYVSILGTLRSLFTHEEFSRQYFEHNSQNQVCDTSKLINFCSGATFKSIELFQKHPESVQLQLASDDFEPCNPVGTKSNRHKICAVYFSIQNIPTKYLSKCKYVFLVAICNSDDVKMKHTDFNNIWYPIVNELKELELNGFAISRKPNLKGTLTQLAFDNLGANTALGFVGSFSSNYFCRFCEMSKAECKQSNFEDPNKLRTIEGYEKQMTIISESTKVIFDQTKGAKYYCLLNDLSYFHIISHPTVDIMHDINEGAIHFTLEILFKQLTIQKIMNPQVLSLTVQFFKYGHLNRSNKPGPVDLEKHNLGQNASQSMCLFKNIPFILFDERKNKKLENIWKIVQALLRIIEIVYSREIFENDIGDLTEQLQIFSTNFLETERHLKPKIHFMLHYPSIIRKMGPIVFMNMMRYERKHRSLKMLISSNYKNLNKSLAEEHQRMLSVEGYSYIDAVNNGLAKPIDQEFGTQNCEILKTNLGVDFNHVKSIKWLEFNGFEYKEGFFIVHESVLLRILKILKNENSFYFVCQPHIISAFEPFLNSYKISETHSDNVIVDFQILKYLKSHEICMVGSTMYLQKDTLDSGLRSVVWNLEPM